MPGKIRKINTGTLAFKLMENISMFTTACKDYGLNDAETFQTVDLFDGENLHQVCVCIHAFGRKGKFYPQFLALYFYVFKFNFFFKALKNGAKGNLSTII